MQDISQKQGRTVLFVSHNVAAVRQLCDRALLLEQGRRRMVGNVNEVLEAYQTVQDNGEGGLRSQQGDLVAARLCRWQISGSDARDPQSCYSGETVSIDYECRVTEPLAKCECHLIVKTASEMTLFHASSRDFGGALFSLESGVHLLSFGIPLPLQRGKYILQAAVISDGKMIDTWLSNSRLVVMDRFERDARHQVPALLNLQSSFSARLVASAEANLTMSAAQNFMPAHR
jgi:lipopolysaccharide transport system ATP-binding protein